MKTNELMIGDWVFNNYHGEKIQITPYDFFTHGHFEDGKYIPTGVTPSTGWDLDPIPITPKILEKNGFEKQEFDGWEFNYLTEGGCLIYEVLWRCDYPKEYHTHLTIKSYSPDFGSFKSFRIDSVHELQHALRLCGIKKEIML